MEKIPLFLVCTLLALPACERPQVEAPPLPTMAPPPRIPTPAPLTMEEATGSWVVRGETSSDVILFANGQAVLPAKSLAEPARGRRGLWRVESGRVLILLAGGGSAFLERSDSGFRFAFEKLEGGGGPAEKLDSTKAWSPGVWRLNKDFDGNFVYASLLSDARAFSTLNGGTEGRWELTEEGILCTWPDGWVDLIRRMPEGYAKESWVGTRNIAVPPELSPVVRVGEAEFLVVP